jgi:hypothetical protein
MFNNRLVRATMFAGAMAVSFASVPTSAQSPVVVGAGNLVNVQVGSIQVIDDVEVRNVLNNLTVSVGVAANIAANVCGVAVGVLAQDLARGSDFACETADQFVQITQ